MCSVDPVDGRVVAMRRIVGWSYFRCRYSCGPFLFVVASYNEENSEGNEGNAANATDNSTSNRRYWCGGATGRWNSSCGA